MNKNFFNQHELQLLIQSVIDNYDLLELKNTIHLQNIGVLIDKLIDHFRTELNVRVKHLQSFIFLASSTTMSSITNAPDQGWHIDGTNQLVDGDCYNVWIPLYNDSTKSGIEIITEKENKKLYQELGDVTYPIMVFTLEGFPSIFELLNASIAKDSDLILIKPNSGKILSVKKGELYIRRHVNPQSGDIEIFKQSELHRGFHDNGIRIQLSLKFRDENAALNSKPSNPLYKIFETYSQGQGGYNEFRNFLKFFTPKGQITKHGMLEKDLIMTLLKNELRYNQAL